MAVYASLDGAMANRQAAEKLLEAAKRVAEAEYWLEQARQEYWSLFKQATNHNTKKKAATMSVPSISPATSGAAAAVAETKTAMPDVMLGQNGSSTVLQRVHQFLLRTRKPQDAKGVVAALEIPINSVRWALVILTQKGLASRVSRGKYAAVVAAKEGEHTV